MPKSRACRRSLRPERSSGQALAARKHLGAFDARTLGEALLAHGEVLELAGRLEEAAEVFGEALSLYESRRAIPLAEKARTRLGQLNARIAR